MTAAHESEAEVALDDQSLQGLAPPTEDLLIDADVANAARELDARGIADAQVVREVLEVLTGGSPVLDNPAALLHHPSAIFADHTTSFHDLMMGLYVPGDAEPAWLPASQRYIHQQTWTGPRASAVAYKHNGKLSTIQGVNTLTANETAWAGVYARLQTRSSTHGSLSRMTVDPEIHWTHRDHMDVSRQWNRNIDGRMRFEYRIWTVVYQYNVATRRWERLDSNRSARITTIASSSWHVGGGGGFGGRSGTLRNGDASLSFVVQPPRTYLFGVLIELRSTHDLTKQGGGSIPQPSIDELNAYGLFKADVPRMQMSRVLLAP